MIILISCFPRQYWRGRWKILPLGLAEGNSRIRIFLWEWKWRNISADCLYLGFGLSLDFLQKMEGMRLRPLRNMWRRRGMRKKLIKCRLRWFFRRLCSLRMPLIKIWSRAIREIRFFCIRLMNMRRRFWMIWEIRCRFMERRGKGRILVALIRFHRMKTVLYLGLRLKVLL